MNDKKRFFVWCWDPILVSYHDIIARCYENIEAIQTSIWSKIFRKLARRKLNTEYALMDWANERVEERVKEIETTYGETVVRFNSLTGEWLS